MYVCCYDDVGILQMQSWDSVGGYWYLFVLVLVGFCAVHMVLLGCAFLIVALGSHAGLVAMPGPNVLISSLLLFIKAAWLKAHMDEPFFKI